MIKKIRFTPFVVILLTAFALGFSGCEENSFEDAADEAGDAMDEAGDATSDAVDDAGDAVDDAAN